MHNAVVWLDTRTKDIVKDLREEHGEEKLEQMRQRCGLPLNTYFSAVKMRWLLENSAAVGALAKSDPHGDELCFSTIDTWLIAKLSGLHSVVTDSTNASRTMLMDLATLEWSQENLDLFGVNKSWLPSIVKNSSDDFGKVDPEECP